MSRRPTGGRRRSRPSPRQQPCAAPSLPCFPSSCQGSACCNARVSREAGSRQRPAADRACAGEDIRDLEVWWRLCFDSHGLGLGPGIVFNVPVEEPISVNVEPLKAPSNFLCVALGCRRVQRSVSHACCPGVSLTCTLPVLVTAFFPASSSGTTQSLQKVS